MTRITIRDPATHPLEHYWSNTLTLKELVASLAEVYGINERQAYLDVQALWDQVKRQRRERAA